MKLITIDRPPQTQNLINQYKTGLLAGGILGQVPIPFVCSSVAVFEMLTGSLGTL